MDSNNSGSSSSSSNERGHLTIDSHNKNKDLSNYSQDGVAGRGSQSSQANFGSKQVNAKLALDSALYLQSITPSVQLPTVNNKSTPRQHKLTTINNGKSLISSNNISVDYIDCLSNFDLVNKQQSTKNQVVSPQMLARKNSSLAMRRHLKFAMTNNKLSPSQTKIESSSNNLSQPTYNDQQNPELRLVSSITNDDELGPSESTRKSVSQSPSPSPSPSVLYPILASDVKRRTYLIGSVSQDSLLGHEQLYRYFPSGKISIFVCTWNQNRKRAPININELLFPESLTYVPDLYAIGVQESFSSQADYLRDWEVQLQANLGSSHVMLHSASLGVLHLCLFIRRDLIWFCSLPEDSIYNSRAPPTNMIKTKGAVSICFKFFGTSLLFINCHFPPHENRLKNRIDEYDKIINSIDLPKNLKLLKPRYLSNDITARFDCVFFLGDLNFRLTQRSFDETILLLEQILQAKDYSDRKYEPLTQYDELLSTLESGAAFNGFDESVIKFPPTYKFLAQTNKYDRQSKRVPSYTDRILFRSKRRGHIEALAYDWLPALLSSDHKPVYCLFNALIRPGHDRNMLMSLNAGLFHRQVYLDALKRLAEDPDSLAENETGSNVCSVS